MDYNRLLQDPNKDEIIFYNQTFPDCIKKKLFLFEFKTIICIPDMYLQAFTTKSVIKSNPL